MGVRHAEHAVFGVQFHPESILTEHGKALLANFLRAGARRRAARGVMRATRSHARCAARRFARDEMRALVRELVAARRARRRRSRRLLAALRMRGETLDEIVGAAEAHARAGAAAARGAGRRDRHLRHRRRRRGHVQHLDRRRRSSSRGAGVPVAKHGNRAASSRCGSADVLEALGVAIDVAPERMARAVREVGIGFLFAPACHPAMARVAPVRAALGVRTLFNLLGPLTNPCACGASWSAWPTAALLEPMAAALLELGAERVWVVHGEDGLDELSLAAPTRVLIRGGRPRERFSGRAGRARSRAPTRAALAGGDAAENARIARAVLAGEQGAERDAVLLNAAAALCVAGRARDSAPTARSSPRTCLDERPRARRVLERFVAFTRGGGMSVLETHPRREARRGRGAAPRARRARSSSARARARGRAARLRARAARGARAARDRGVQARLAVEGRDPRGRRSGRDRARLRARPAPRRSRC